MAETGKGEPTTWDGVQAVIDGKTYYAGNTRLMDEALLQLLEKKDFAFLSVKEICQKAGVSRSTFYLHYETIDDLLEEATEWLNEKFVASFPKDVALSLHGKILTSREFLLPYLTFVKENRRAFRLVYQKPELFSAEKTFRAMYRDVFDPALDSFNVAENEKEYVLEFYTKGSLAIIQRWVEKDCEDDIDFIVDLIARHTTASGN